MIKKILIFVSIAVIFIAILYKYSYRNIDVKNGFERNFSPTNPVMINSKKLESGPYSIVEGRTNDIVLYKFRSPFNLYHYSYELNNTDNRRLPILSTEDNFKGLNTLFLIKNHVYILSGATASIYGIKFPNKAVKMNKLNSIPIYHGEIIDTNSLIFVSVKKIDSSYLRVLKKVNFQGTELNSFYPKRQIDGYFCNDGMFKYDMEAKKLIYMYYYRGSLACLDNSLKLIYEINTIDTIRHSKIYLKAKKNTITQATPPNIVNKRFCVDQKNIYVHSALKADNESSEDFLNSQTIDVYDLNSGKYKISFHLPKYKRQKLTEFKVKGNHLIALFSNVLAVYKMPYY
jgi:hypothetical protein